MIAAFPVWSAFALHLVGLIAGLAVRWVRYVRRTGMWAVRMIPGRARPVARWARVLLMAAFLIGAVCIVRSVTGTGWAPGDPVHPVLAGATAALTVAGLLVVLGAGRPQTRGTAQT